MGRKKLAKWIYEDELSNYIKTGTFRNYLVYLRRLPPDIKTFSDDELVKVMNKNISYTKRGNTAHIARSAYIFLLRYLNRENLQLRLIKTEIHVRRISKKWLPFSTYQEMLSECKNECVRLITMMQYDGCTRVSAILNANISNLSTEQGTLSITETKTEEIRTIALSPMTFSLLRKYIEIYKEDITRRKGKLFDMTYHKIWRLQKLEFMRLLGDEEGSKISTHWARASRAVHLVQKGYDIDTIKTIGGWSSADSVAKYIKESGYKAQELMKEEPVKW